MIVHQMKQERNSPDAGNGFTFDDDKSVEDRFNEAHQGDLVFRVIHPPDGDLLAQTGDQGPVGTPSVPEIGHDATRHQGPQDLENPPDALLIR